MEALPVSSLIYFIVFVSLYFLLRSYANGQLLKLWYGIPFIGIKYPYVYGNIERKQLALRIADLYNEHSHPIIGIRLLATKNALIIKDLSLVSQVLQLKFSHFQNRGLFYNARDDPLSAILGTVDHGDWTPMRKKLSPIFKPKRMQNIFPQLKDICDGLVENLLDIVGDGERIMEIIGTFSEFTTDAIGAVAFGNHCKETAKKLREMVAKSKQPHLVAPWIQISVAFPGLARALRVTKHSKEVSDFFVNYVTEIVQDRQEKNIRPNDFMQSLIDAELGIPRISAIAFDLLSAGYADSTSTLACCLYELALNKEIQSRARDEVRNFLKKKDEFIDEICQEDEGRDDLEKGQFTYEILQRMSYIRQIIKEVERKYPVAGIATRVATKAFKVPGSNITIPRGMKVFVPIYAIHHDHQYYRDPEAFDPDRFTKESESERAKNSFLPFGLGPRKCLGFIFAEMLIGIGLVALLNAFEFSPCPETEIPIVFNQNKITLHPKSVTLSVRRIED